MTTDGEFAGTKNGAAAIELISDGHRSLITIRQSDGQVTIHPDAVAVVDGDRITVKFLDAPPSITVRRGEGFVGGGDWLIIVGDVLWKAIEDGELRAGR